METPSVEQVVTILRRDTAARAELTSYTLGLIEGFVYAAGDNRRDATAVLAGVRNIITARNIVRDERRSP